MRRRKREKKEKKKKPGTEAPSPVEFSKENIKLTIRGDFGSRFSIVHSNNPTG